MMKSVIYESETYHPEKARLYYLGIVVIGTVLIILYSAYSRDYDTGFTLWFILMLFSLLIVGPIRQRICRRGVVEINDKQIRISEYGDYDDTLITDVIVQWDDISGYHWGMTSDGCTRFILYLKNGTEAGFRFIEGKSREQAINQKSIFSVFFYFLTQRNKNLPNTTIAHQPGFLTSFAGGAILVFLTVFVIAMILIGIFQGKVGSGRLIIILAPIIAAFNRRGDDKEFTSTVSTIKPLSWDELNPDQNITKVAS